MERAAPLGQTRLRVREEQCVNYPGGRPIRRKRTRRRRRIRILLGAAGATLILTVLFGAGWFVCNRNHPSSETSPASEPDSKGSDLAVLAGPLHRPIQTAKSKRPVYNYSVVRGGVRTPQELREATLRDPQVASHYAGFRFEKARMVHLQEPVLAYLSYRRNGQIFWTKTKHRLNAGEPVITDGEISGRARCANRISVRKQMAVSPEPDPSPAELNQLEAPALPPALVSYPTQFQTAMLAPATTPGTTAGPGGPFGGVGPFFPGGGGGGGGRGGPPGPGGGGGGGKPPGPPGGGSGGGGGGGGGGGCPPRSECPPPPTPVPESGTLLLLSSGLATLACLKWKLARH